MVGIRHGGSRSDKMTLAKNQLLPTLISISRDQPDSKRTTNSVSH